MVITAWPLAEVCFLIPLNSSPLSCAFAAVMVLFRAYILETMDRNF